jgi:cell division initiation protein
VNGMEKFKRSINGYNIDEVNAFIDDVITKVELIITEEKKIKNDIVIKEKKIRELEDAILRYQNMENQLHTSLLNAEQNGEYIKKVAKSEGNAIISEAKRNANRIISDALIRAEKTEHETQMLKNNISLFKSKVKSMLNEQLEIVDKIDDIL